MTGISAKEIAEKLGGTVEGNPDVRVDAPARIEYGRPGTVCFYANPKYEHYIYSCKADIILVSKDFQPKEPISATLVRLDDPYAGVAALLKWFNDLKKQRRGGNRFRCRLRPSVSIAASARIGKGTYIYPQVYLGPHVKVGRGCILYPGVKVYHDCIIGDGCILHANSVIGADGFGFAPEKDGTYSKIPQTGNVILEDNVEIGACTTIDRSTMGSTVIHSGVKIDNLCQVAHNVEVGDNTVIAAQSGVAGSTKLGKHCVIGGQSGVIGHIEVADNTTLAARSGIIGNVRKEGEVLLGYPAFDHKEYLKAYAAFKAAAKKSK